MNFKNNLFKLFKTIKVNRSSFVCIHLDAKIFNDNNIEKKKIKENIKILLNYFNKKGTIVIPTFSYSFTDKKNYDIIKSKSKVGFLTNEILKLKGVKRTLHPEFSFAISGKKEKDILMCDIKNCFGKNTVFDYLIKKKATIISLACSFDQMTILHHIEQISNVPYRFNKIFKGDITKNKKILIKNLKIGYFVQKKNKYLSFNSNKLKKTLLGSKIIKRSIFGRFYCYSTNATKFSDFLSKKIKSNPYYLVK